MLFGDDQLACRWSASLCSNARERRVGERLRHRQLRAIRGGRSARARRKRTDLEHERLALDPTWRAAASTCCCVAVLKPPSECRRSRVGRRRRRSRRGSCDLPPNPPTCSTPRMNPRADFSSHAFELRARRALGEEARELLVERLLDGAHVLAFRDGCIGDVGARDLVAHEEGAASVAIWSRRRAADRAARSCRSSTRDRRAEGTCSRR